MKKILILTLVFVLISSGFVFFVSCACAHTSDFVITSAGSDCCAQTPACHSYLNQTTCSFLDLVPTRASDFKTPSSLDLNLAKKEGLLPLSVVQNFREIDSSKFVPSKAKTYLLNSILLI